MKYIMKCVYSLLVVVKSHLFPQFIKLNREIGSGRGHLGDRRVLNCQSRVGGAYLGRRQSSPLRRTGNPFGNEVAAAVTHNSDS